MAQAFFTCKPEELIVYKRLTKEQKRKVNESTRDHWLQQVDACAKEPL